MIRTAWPGRRRADFRTALLRATYLVNACPLAAGGLLAAQHQARRIGLGDQLSVFVGHVALDVPDRAASLHHPAFGAKQRLPYRTKEIDFELDGGEGFARAKRAGERNAHRRVCDVAQDSPVQRAHGIGVLWAGLQGHHGAAAARPRTFKTEQPRPRRRGPRPPPELQSRATRPPAGASASIVGGKSVRRAELRMAQSFILRNLSGCFSRFYWMLRTGRRLQKKCRTSQILP